MYVKVLIELLDPMSPMNLEFKGPSGPSTGHSLLVQGLEKLLANAETHGDHALESRMLEQSRTEWEGGEDTTGESLFHPRVLAID